MGTIIVRSMFGYVFSLIKYCEFCHRNHRFQLHTRCSRQKCVNWLILCVRKRLWILCKSGAIQFNGLFMVTVGMIHLDFIGMFLCLIRWYLTFERSSRQSWSYQNTKFAKNEQIENNISSWNAENDNAKQRKI